MDFFELVNRRRSVRKFTDKKVPEEIIKKCLRASVLAPNSSKDKSKNPPSSTQVGRGKVF